MTTEAGSSKPLPAMRGLAAQFYESCRRHELRFQRCRSCSAWRHVPREMCPGCGSWDWHWAPSSGRGRLFSWTVVARPLHPAFAAAAPYAPAVIEMEEGVRLLSCVVDTPPDELTIGMPLTVDFEDLTLDISLPVFRRA